MKSTVEMSPEMTARFDAYIESHDVTNGNRPEKFINILKTHHNIIDFMNLDEPFHIEKRNPLMAVIGDSVSCGHFEMIDLSKMLVAHEPSKCYMEVLRQLLQEHYPLTCISLINSAIAGDNIRNMEKRLSRDIISHQPDLVVINASLNWSEHRGTLEDFKESYRNVIERIMAETEAEIILLTPNVAVYDEEMMPRVEYVRQLADEYVLTLVDIHRMYTDVLKPEEYADALSNRENHPTVYGHRLFARAIMTVLV